MMATLTHRRTEKARGLLEAAHLMKSETRPGVSESAGSHLGGQTATPQPTQEAPSLVADIEADLDRAFRAAFGITREGWRDNAPNEPVTRTHFSWLISRLSRTTERKD